MASNAQIRRDRFKKTGKEKALRPITPTKRQEMQYRNVLLGAVQSSKTAVMELYATVADLATFNSLIEEVFANMTVWDELNLQVGANIDSMDNIHRQAFYKTVTEGVGVNVGAFVTENGLEDLLESMTATNVDQVTNLEEDVKNRVSNLVNNSLTGQEAKSPSLERQLRELFNGASNNQARFIARDQTQRAVNGLNRFRQESTGIKKYKWLTSRDSRVRNVKGDNHVIMNGLEVEWASGRILPTMLAKKRGVAGKNVKTVANGHVGQSYNCRCSAVALLETP